MSQIKLHTHIFELQKYQVRNDLHHCIFCSDPSLCPADPACTLIAASPATHFTTCRLCMYSLLGLHDCNTFAEHAAFLLDPGSQCQRKRKWRPSQQLNQMLDAIVFQEVFCNSQNLAPLKISDFVGATWFCWETQEKTIVMVSVQFLLQLLWRITAKLRQHLGLLGPGLLHTHWISVSVATGADTSKHAASTALSKFTACLFMPRLRSLAFTMYPISTIST